MRKRLGGGFTSLMYAFCIIAGNGAAADGLREVPDPRSGMMVRFPSTWRYDSSGETFRITSFPPGERRPLSGLARNGAGIVLFRAERTGRPIASLRDWLLLDRESPNSTARSLDTKHFKGVDAVRVEWREPNLRGVSGVTYYVRLPDRFLKIQLSFDGEQRRAEFIRVLEELLDNLAILPE